MNNVDDELTVFLFFLYIILDILSLREYELMNGDDICGGRQCILRQS